MSIFKAYDVRGTVPDQLNVDLAKKIGLAYANVILEEVKAKKGAAAPKRVKIGVGRDARPSGDTLVPALLDGLTSGGADVVDLGKTTTPMVYYAVGSLGLDGGVIATASHNPPQYNGFKFTREQAIPISKETGIGEFEKRILAGKLTTTPERGSISTHNIFAAYQAMLQKFSQNQTAKKLKVAIDTANGMAGLYVPIFNALNIEVVPLYFDIDCRFPNHEANPLKEETLAVLKKTVKEKKCDFGVGFDGDADRCVCVDETGTVVRPDIMTGLLATVMLERHKGAAILYDLRSSWIVPETIKRLGGRPIRERVGHSFMKATMRKEGCVFGGELSGHSYWQAIYTSDSAILLMIEVLNLMRKTGQKLSALVAPLMVYHSTGEINFHVDDKDGMMKTLETKYGPKGAGGKVDWLDGVTVEFAEWWFNVRPSNTEPLLRLTLECKKAADLPNKLGELKALLGTPVH